MSEIYRNGKNITILHNHQLPRRANENWKMRLGNRSSSRDVQTEDFSLLETEQCINCKAFKLTNPFFKGLCLANGDEIERRNHLMWHIVQNSGKSSKQEVTVREFS
jgi:hypothetical protein